MLTAPRIGKFKAFAETQPVPVQPLTSSTAPTARASRASLTILSWRATHCTRGSSTSTAQGAWDVHDAGEAGDDEWALLDYEDRVAISADFQRNTSPYELVVEVPW